MARLQEIVEYLEVGDEGRKDVEGHLQVSERKNKEMPSRQITETT
jgi:hypothetical protein